MLLDFDSRRYLLSVQKVIGYSFLGCGTVFIVVAVFIFFNVIGKIAQFPLISHESNPLALAECVPYLILAVISYVIGGVSYCMRRVNPTTPLVPPNKIEMKSTKILRKLKKLESIDDVNLNVFITIPDEINENQHLVTQSTMVQAKKE